MDASTKPNLNSNAKPELGPNGEIPNGYILKHGRLIKPRKSKNQRVTVLWQPQQKQAEALVRTEFEILYGGARGGGKTDAGMAWLLYEKDNPMFRGLVIRLNAKDLNDWVDRAKKMYASTGAEFVGQPTEIRFPSGALIRTGHLKDENAYTQYQGHEYQKILIEELTQIPFEKNYEQLISSCRSTVENLQPQIFCTTNPGNLGHEWVRRRWQIVGTPKGVIETKTDYGNRIFIPSTVYDNPKLVHSNPFYVKQLESISDTNLRKAWLEGSWDAPVVEGQVYKNELLDARVSGRISEVPHDPRFPVFTWWDIGTSDATAIGFFQHISGSWRMIDYFEEANRGFDYFNQILSSKGYFYGAHYGPHDLKQRERSSAISTQTIAEQLGLYFQIVDRVGREEGINMVRVKFPLLWIDEKKCSKFLDAIRNYRYEEHERGSLQIFDEETGNMKPYKPQPIHDWSSHAADMLRYWAVSPDPVLPGDMQGDYKLFNTNYK